MFLDGVHHGLHDLVIGDVVDGFDYCIAFGAIVPDDLLVVDDAIPLCGVWDGIGFIAIFESVAFALVGE